MHMVPVNNTHERYVVFQYWPINEWRVKQMNPGPWQHGEKEYRAWAWLIVKLYRDGSGNCLFVHWGKWGDGLDFPEGRAFPVTAGFHGSAAGDFMTGRVDVVAFNYRGAAFESRTMELSELGHLDAYPGHLPHRIFLGHHNGTLVHAQALAKQTR